MAGVGRAAGFCPAPVRGKPEAGLNCLEPGCSACGPRPRMTRFQHSAERRSARREFLDLQRAFDKEKKLAHRQGREPDEELGNKYFAAYEKYDAIAGAESFSLGSGSPGFTGHSM